MENMKENMISLQDGEGINIVGGENVDYGANCSYPQKTEKEKGEEVTRNAEKTE